MKSFKGTIYQQVNSIIQDVHTKATTISSEMSRAAEIDLLRVHDQIIGQYYGSYKPKSYKRHSLGGLYYTADSHKSKPIGNSGLTQRASLVVSNRLMPERYRIDSSVIFDLMWNHGVRGLPHHGNTPLNKTYNWYASGLSSDHHCGYFDTPDGQLHQGWFVHYQEGERWTNPFWSGNSEPYSNIFLAKVTYQKYKATKAEVPHLALLHFTENWTETGNEYLKNIVDKIRE